MFLWPRHPAELVPWGSKVTVNGRWILGAERGSAPLAWVRPAEEGGGVGEGEGHTCGAGLDKKTNICWTSPWGWPSPAPSTCPKLSSSSSLESAPVPSSLPPWMASPPPPWPSGGPFTSPPPVLCMHIYQDFSIHLPKPSASTLSLPFPLPGLPPSLSGPALSSKYITGASHVILDSPVATLTLKRKLVKLMLIIYLI